MEPRRAAGAPQGANRVLAERIRLAPVGSEAQRVSAVHHHHRRPEHPLPACALPLIISHGYPSWVVEFLSILGPLTDPRAHGGDPADAFHVVAPSLPGYGFSVPVRQTGWDMPHITRAWSELMGRLGYERYGAHGGDIGAGIT